MSLAQRIVNGTIHRALHQSNSEIEITDDTCSICHPPLETPRSFEIFWEFFFNYIAPSADDYSEITVQRFLQTDRLRQRILETQTIEISTTTILQHYQRVIHAIHYRRNLRRTSTELAVQTFLIALLTNNFDERLVSNRINEHISDFQNPLLNDRPLYQIVETTLQTFAQLERSTRTRNELAPEIPITQRQPTSRTDTPVPSLDETNPNSEEEEEFLEQEARLNALYNRTQEELDQLFPDPQEGPSDDEEVITVSEGSDINTDDELEALARFFNPELYPPLSPDQQQALNLFPMAGRIFKPDYFYGKNEEDAEQWLRHFEKIAHANEWDDDAKYRMVPIFLKEVAERWWGRTRTTAWEDDNADNTVIGFKERFLENFAGKNKVAKWQDQFENIRQGKRTIEEYNEDFRLKLKRADPQEELPQSVIIRKYVKSIKPEIAQKVYYEGPTTIDQAMMVAERCERGQELIKGSSENYLNEIEELRHQINMLKLGVDKPEVVEISAADPPLNRPYNNNNNRTNNWNNNRPNNWNNNNNNRSNNWNNNKQNNQNGNNNRRNFPKGTCHRCGRFGHFQRNCRQGQN